MLPQNLGFMNKRSFLLVLFTLNIGLYLSASSDSLQRTNLHSFELVHLQNPWLFTTNPAALSQMNLSLKGILNVDYSFENGDYKRVQQGDKMNSYKFATSSYSQINDISLYGSFNFEKSLENGLNYSNVNDPFRLTPYQVVDTIGNDIYDREFYSASGGISKPFGNKLILGLASDFTVGLAAQNRDPRPQNKVFNMTVSPGLIWKLDKFKLGANFIYQYYNEEIEINIVRANYQATFFTLHGPGIATFHEAASFNRLYMRNSLGFDLQFAYENSKTKSINGLRFLVHEETAGDGRKAADASWSYIKDDSQLNAFQFDLYNTTSLMNNERIHSFGYMLNVNTLLGKEIIQRLERIDGIDMDDWVTYGVEEKYGAEDFKLNVYYHYFKLKSGSQKDCGLKLYADYHSFIENYYIPNQEAYYKNLSFGISIDKVFYPHSKSFSLGMNLKYKMNLDGAQNFSDYTFLAEKILMPDFEYLTCNYLAPGLNVAFEIPTRKIFDQYFIKSAVEFYLGSNGQSRTIFNLSTGVTF